MTLRILYPFVGDSIGGSHVSTLSLISGLDREKFNPVILVHQDSILADYLADRQIPFVLHTELGVLNRGTLLEDCFGILCRAYGISKVLKRHKIDLVHTNDLRMHLTWGLGARLAGCGVVWHQRTGDDSRRNALFSMLAHRILTISEYCKSCMPGSMGRRANVIYNPFEDDDSASREVALRNEIVERSQLSGEVSPDVKIVGFVGNLQHQKRPLHFIKVSEIVAQRYNKAVLFPMFGERRMDVLPLVEQKIAELNLDKMVVLMGHKMPISPWIAACDVVVAPGTNEGFGRVLVEAMLSKTPVVASDDSGHKEIITNGVTGFLSDPQNPEAMADDVLKILSDEDAAQKMAQAAYADAGRRFSLLAHVHEVQDIYEAISEGRPE